MEPKIRINGATLPKYNGKQVVLIGTVQQIDASGQNVQVKASDNQFVVVKLGQELQENLEGIVEFHGTASGRNVMADFYINFPSDYTQNFDMEMYDNAVKLIHTLGNNPWNID